MNLFIILLITGVFAIMWFLSGFRVVREGERGIIERNGKFAEFVTPGRTFVMSGLQKLHIIDVSEKTIRIYSHPVNTKDNVTCLVDVNVTYRISDLEESIKKIFYDIHDYRKSITDHVKNDLLEIFASYTLKEVPENILKIRSEARHESISLSNHFYITNIEFQKIQYPEDIQKSINDIIEKDLAKVAAKKTVEAEKLKAAELRKLEKEKTQLLKEEQLQKSESKRRAVERVKKEQLEALAMIKEKVDTDLKDTQSKIEKMYSEALKKSVKKVEEND